MGKRGRKGEEAGPSHKRAAVSSADQGKAVAKAPSHAASRRKAVKGVVPGGKAKGRRKEEVEEVSSEGADGREELGELEHVVALWCVYGVIDVHDVLLCVAGRGF
jgi:hypothetical protein